MVSVVTRAKHDALELLHKLLHALLPRLLCAHAIGTLHDAASLMTGGAAGIIAGIVGYILVNSVNWLLDKCADLISKMQDPKVRPPNQQCKSAAHALVALHVMLWIAAMLCSLSQALSKLSWQSDMMCTRHVVSRPPQTSLLPRKSLQLQFPDPRQQPFTGSFRAHVECMSPGAKA